MSNFIKFRSALNVQFALMATQEVLVADVSREELWNTYLNAFPEGTNPIYKERTEHDCNCCRGFIYNIGAAVAYVDGQLTSIWNTTVDSEYQAVADAMHALVMSKPVTTRYAHYSKQVGNVQTFQQIDDTPVITWEHYHQELPAKLVMPMDAIATFQGKATSQFQVLKRSITEITPEAVATVIELIESDNLYRGNEYLGMVQLLDQLQASATSDEAIWKASINLGGGSNIRNTVIGTLLVDISEGVPLDKAVLSFEQKVAPTNYKRSKSLITEAMISRAYATVEELGIADSLQRRHATIEDISINDVFWADNSAKKSMGVFDAITPTKAPTEIDSTNVLEMGIEEFMADVLPQVTSLEVFVSNQHTTNMVSLLAPAIANTPPILKWGNNFSWSYHGDITDSMREQVRSAGGNVEGAFRFTHSWNHDGNNQSLMDLHVFLPGNNPLTARAKCHDNYGNSERVGWNQRQHLKTGGIQDVDYVNPAGTTIPIENISFPSLSKMPEGTYTCAIHNWQLRPTTTSGFKAEIEFDGQIHQYNYPAPLAHKEWVYVAEVTLEAGQFTIKHLLDSSTTSKEVWGIPTQHFTKVATIMLSPNHWVNEAGNGNKHYMFMLANCKNPDPVRGLYNEFLGEGLQPHRKVFEVLGAKLKAPYSDSQLSGLGFSDTQRNSLLCKVRGGINRLIMVNF